MNTTITYLELTVEQKWDKIIKFLAADKSAGFSFVSIYLSQNTRMTAEVKPIEDLEALKRRLGHLDPKHTCLLICDLQVWWR